MFTKHNDNNFISTPLKTIFLSEMILVFAMVFGIVSREFSYLILVLLVVSFIKLNVLDSLKLFIISIPFFVALPANSLSDSMSVWRILILILFLKVVYEKYKFIGCRCDDGRLSNQEKNKRNYKLKLCKTKIGIATALMSIAMTKIKNFRLSYIKEIIKPLKKHNSSSFQLENNYRKLFFLTVLFFIITFISLIFAQNPIEGIKKILFLINIFILFPIVIFTIKKEYDIREILKVILYASVIIVIIGYFQFLSTFLITLSQFWEFWAGNVIKTFYGQNLSHLLSYSNTWFSYYNVLPPTLRMFSVLPDSHSFAMIVIISIPVVLSFIFYYKQKKYLYILLMFFLLAIFFSGSRGAWTGSIFALMAGLSLYLSLSIKEKKDSKIEKFSSIISEFIKLLKSKVDISSYVKNNSKYYSKLITFSVLLFFILMPVSSLIIKQNQEIQIMRSNIMLSDHDRSKFSMIERTFSISDFNETSNKGRIQIWLETLSSIKERPLFGVGFGNFNYILNESSSSLKKGSSAHSIYLDIAAEIGIFGLVIFLFLIIEILKMSYKLYFRIERKYLKIFAGSFFVYFTWICAYGIFDVVIFNDKVLMIVVVLIGILYSIDGIENEFR